MHPAASVPALRRLRQLVVVALGCCALLGVAHHATALAQGLEPGTGSSYITPFPPGDIYKAQVYGDELAEGLLQGLAELQIGQERIEFPRKHRALPSMIRAEAEDEIRAEEQSRDPVHVGIVMMGLNDRGPMRVAGSSSVRFGTPSWRELYGARIDKFLKALKRRSVAVYVVGLPPLRRQDANAEAEIVNGMLVEKALANGIRFIEVTESFTDENGAFSQFGPDVAGNREKLRDGDGVGFTGAGNRKLASLVAAELKRDLAAARAERVVPLAGAEVEQKRINPDKAPVVTAIAPWASTVTRDGKDARTPANSTTPPAAAGGVGQRPAGLGDQKSEPGRLTLRLASASGREENVTIELVRPAVSAAVIALLNRKSTVDTAQQPFELLADDVGDGVSVSTMVSALPDAASTRRRGPASLANYTAVWVRGERLPPKPGRADDFTWPRPDNTLVPEVVLAAPTAKSGSPRGAAIPEARPRIPRAQPLPAAQPGNRG